LTSRGWVDPVPDPLLLRKSGSAGNRTRDLCICSQKLWPLLTLKLDVLVGAKTFKLRVLMPYNRGIRPKSSILKYDNRILTAQQPLVGQDLLIIEASRTHSRHTTLGRTPLDERPARRRQHTTLTRDSQPWPRRDSNPQSQQANGRIPTS
jgi:hypothetical protein